jgi:hypothetical protein
MHDDVGIIHKLGNELAVLNVIQKILQPLGTLEVAKIFDTAGGQIVEQHNVIAAINEAVGQMRANETGAASD